MEEEEVRNILSEIHGAPWQGAVYRHMFADIPPERENTRGARWNPSETPAIYTSLTRQVALAEANYHINLQPTRPKARRTLYRIAVKLSNVIDLSRTEILARLGLRPMPTDPSDLDWCQTVGGAAAWMGHDGMIIPSARDHGLNLVIYPNKALPDQYSFEVEQSEIIEESSLPLEPGHSE